MRPSTLIVVTSMCHALRETRARSLMFILLAQLGGISCDRWNGLIPPMVDIAIIVGWVSIYDRTFIASAFYEVCEAGLGLRLCGMHMALCDSV
ncbi:hypothetical protein R3P38DRAFT_3003978 [Favolaschia claudopus]|uniref:Secreted protein n=1 Tax=Favolaschia claudopus TaxID=2862362 RepID=A0AAW0AKT3_9AGAR